MVVACARRRPVEASKAPLQVGQAVASPPQGGDADRETGDAVRVTREDVGAQHIGQHVQPLVTGVRKRFVGIAQCKRSPDVEHRSAAESPVLGVIKIGSQVSQVASPETEELRAGEIDSLARLDKPALLRGQDRVVEDAPLAERRDALERRQERTRQVPIDPVARFHPLLGDNHTLALPPRIAVEPA